MRPRGSISTSEIHFIISKIVPAVRADATEVPTPKTNPLTLAPTVYPLQGGKVHPNFENEKKSEEIFYAPLRPEKYAESSGEIRF